MKTIGELRGPLESSKLAQRKEVTRKIYFYHLTCKSQLYDSLANLYAIPTLSKLFFMLNITYPNMLKKYVHGSKSKSVLINHENSQTISEELVLFSYFSRQAPKNTQKNYFIPL